MALDPAMSALAARTAAQWRAEQRPWSTVVGERHALLHAPDTAENRARAVQLDVEIAELRAEYTGEGETEANEDSYSRGGRYYQEEE